MKKESSELTEKQRATLKALEELPDDRIDTSDIPERLTGRTPGGVSSTVRSSSRSRCDSTRTLWHGSRLAPRAAAATRPTSTARCGGMSSGAKER